MQLAVVGFLLGGGRPCVPFLVLCALYNAWSSRGAFDILLRRARHARNATGSPVALALGFKSFRVSPQLARPAPPQRWDTAAPGRLATIPLMPSSWLRRGILPVSALPASTGGGAAAARGGDDAVSAAAAAHTLVTAATNPAPLAARRAPLEVRSAADVAALVAAEGLPAALGTCYPDGDPSRGVFCSRALNFASIKVKAENDRTHRPHRL